MEKLLLIKQLYLLVKNKPYYVICIQLIINVCLFRLLVIETNDYARLAEILVMLTNLIRLLAFSPLAIDTNSFDKPDKSD